MCGIIAGIAKRDVIPLLLEGLKRLEYRGYDSSGIAVIENNKIQRVRVEGKISALDRRLQTEPLAGNIGMGHTRWATHGAVTERNAHPHVAGDQILLVHNGIIENYHLIKQLLEKKGYIFQSETDSEVAAVYIFDLITEGQETLQAIQNTLVKLEGHYAITVIDKVCPDKIFAARKGAPLIIGVGIGEYFIASDPLALQFVVNQFIYLEEGDVAVISLSKVVIYDQEGKMVNRPLHTKTLHYDAADKGKYRHFMLKEIFEQPKAIHNTLEGCINNNQFLEEKFGSKAAIIFDKTQYIQIVACGTSYHAGLIAKNWLENIANIPCQVDIASEFRYKKNIVQPGTLFVSISQSGETADTLAALKKVRENQNYCGTLAICNVAESALVRYSDCVFLTNAGPEIGVCSTKAFTTQLAALLILVCVLGRRFNMTSKQEIDILQHLLDFPQIIEQFLFLEDIIRDVAKEFVHKEHALFLGRGALLPVVLEGALKLKEISYIHAEAYAAGELKHGPLALVDEEMLVVVVAYSDDVLEKLKSNIQEVKARGGNLIIFADDKSDIKTEPGIRVITVPKVYALLAPIAYIIPLQLLAYHVAVLKGTDVDQPRNLAKSVTVE